MTHLFLLAAAFFLPSLALAQYWPSMKLQPLPPEASAGFEKVGLPQEALGLALVALPKDRPGRFLSGFGVNAALSLNPASTIKLVTTRAALGLLGHDYRHQTRIATTGRLTGDTLQGDLFFQGGGDPKLVVEDLQEIAERLRAMGIGHIRGRLIVDGTRFNEPEIDTGAFDQRPEAAYNVGPHAAMVNFKAMRVLVQPAGGRQPAVQTEPRLPKGSVANRLILVDGGCGRNQINARMDANSKLIVTGVMGRSCQQEADFYVSVLDHVRFVQIALEAAFESAGGTMEVSLESGATPSHARTLVDWESPRPLISLVSDINKLSNNPMTRQVFLNLSANGSAAATRDQSIQVVRRYLASRGLNFPELVLDNGSGLSREERISALSMVRLLTDALLAPDADDWLKTLPIAGFEGTVKNRFRNSPLKGQAWLKTGSLEGVRSYAGYLRSASGQWVVLAITVNHPEAAKAWPAMDRVLLWAYENM
jgi:D-alanyl-D-alanine carboxypeptidase/D-alanyl-D-alanine-endopeptidase (penicillin-binding protein 4)